jgi:hypothetical protein
MAINHRRLRIWRNPADRQRGEKFQGGRMTNDADASPGNADAESHRGNKFCSPQSGASKHTFRDPSDLLLILLQIKC